MEIVITKCSSPDYWYSESVGSAFNVLGTWVFNGELHFRTDGNNSTGHVGADDCELLIKGCRFAVVPKAIEPNEQPSEAAAEGR